MAGLIFASVISIAGAAPSREELEARVRHYAELYDVPPGLVMRIVRQESRFDPSARNGPYWGLMQIRFDTARGVGYSGPVTGLLDPETNLTYGVAYLANAYMVSGGNESRAHKLYKTGYYYEAKRKRMLAQLIKVPTVAQPQVVLASIVPSPTAIEAAFVETSAVEDVIVMPIPRPKPGSPTLVAEVAPAPTQDAAAVVPEPTPKPQPTAVAAEAPSIVPLPRPRPGLDVRVTLVASVAMPVPRPRPMGSAGRTN
ncbi:transglycosylase SLT domain-containing protein [Kaistia dalseonensis]|uniref:Transglycosylase SLT domain-containing protein n=1 Tax=Kaistia dalseonensis TaxID=410840 RepID=A0ABU0H928_9HYPH|nr:transglycosylase SLT domain-containing protein [Kaistia dalseonensis]MCX5495656.1 transglycosylase SLT domain-containing protein [Kaistia dalseonensis]MDQ0438250.1 hypothetical protein [Kaistia dalseonensis]